MKLENNEECWKIYKSVETIKYTSKQPMGQEKNQKGNKKLFPNKGKQKYNIKSIIEFNKSSQEKVYSDNCIY